jgi:DNA-binding NarL/FixJ family response regulator
MLTSPLLLVPASSTPAAVRDAVVRDAVVRDQATAPLWMAALPNIGSLSGRESEVFGLLGAGRSNREISSTLCVSECTVKKHIGAIMTKLGLQSRLQIGLAALAHQFGCTV